MDSLSLINGSSGSKELAIGEDSPDVTLNHPLLELGDSTKFLGVQVVLIMAYSTIILLGVVGNSLVIYVVYKFKTLRTVTNFFIANLAVADLLVNTLCLPFTLAYTLLKEWKFGQVLCFTLPYAQGLAVHVSTITLNVIALDRHRCIVYHLDTRMSKDTCFLVIAITWVVSAILASPLAIFREYGIVDLSPDNSIEVCGEKWPDSSTDSTLYSWVPDMHILMNCIISFLRPSRRHTCVLCSFIKCHCLPTALKAKICTFYKYTHFLRLNVDIYVNRYHLFSKRLITLNDLDSRLLLKSIFIF